jgi:cardiolipin synthase A/B
MKGKPYSSATQAELVKSGTDFFRRAAELIHKATQKIQLQTYILSDDETGREIIHGLIAASARGVEVYVLADAFGSHELKRETIELLGQKGIHFRTYSPLFVHYKLRFGRRFHHKILVTDRSEALIGGINMDNHYHLPGKDSPWLDYAVYLNGEVCTEVDTMCTRLWSKKGYFRITKKDSNKVGNKHLIQVRLEQNDWLYRKRGVSSGLINAVRKAEDSVTIVASYFLPGSRMRSALKNAAKRGVHITLILPGISDVELVKNAMSYWYAWLLRNHIELYEWNETILHGKLMAVDTDWVSIGSYNINHLSHFSSIETNVEIKNVTFSRQVREELNEIKNKCYKVTPDENRKRANPMQMFIWWSSFKLVRFLFWLQFRILSKE